METLQAVFPAVPIEALERVLDVCDQNVEAASDWLLSNDWQELMEDEEDIGGAAQNDDRDEETVEDGEGGVGVNHRRNQTASAANGSHGTSGSIAMPGVLPNRRVASPTSSHGSEQPGLTMAFSAGPSSTLGLDDGRHRANRVRSHQRHSHRHGDDDIDQDYDSAVDLDADSEDGDEEEEEDDDDDDEDDDGDANSYYDSGDESFYTHTMPQLAKRLKITRDASKLGEGEYFWPSFDGQIVPKTLIELLNTTLTKIAHSSVMLLSKSSKVVDEAEARQRLKSVLKQIEVAHGKTSLAHRISSGSSLSRILNASQPESSQDDAAASTGLKRKRVEDHSASSPMGFFAYFFSISDLDMVWRSILHPHVFNGRFGDVVEFHTASSGAFSKKDFDELMHIHTNVASSSRSAALGLSPLSGLKCCLLLPCEARDDEIFRVGKHLHSLLKIPGSLYYRTVEVECSELEDGNPPELLNEDGKLSEESFRRYARYRIKKEEVEPTDKAEKDSMGVDHFLAYQQQRKVDYCLQFLEKESWVQRASG